ncbi:MAG: gliding motility-associated C-terminal domain-containing protein [Bacteroidota bacterium]
MTVSAWYKSGVGFDGGDIFTKYLNASWNGWECALSGTGELIPHYLIANTPCNGIIQGYTGCGNPSGFNYPGPTNDGNWHHVVFKVDASGGTLFVDGQQVGQHPWIGSPTPVTTTASLLIGPEFEGSVDDVGIWNRALSTDEIGYLFNTGTASVCNGSSISIAGSGANIYSWNTGATTQAITVSPTSATSYTVTGTNALGCSSSNTFTVNVLPLTIPSVSVTPSTTAICLGDSVTFVATPINGGTTPTYQWKINGVNVAGATGSSFSSTTLNNNDVITVQLNSNATPCLSGNPTTSSPVTISVNQPAVPSVSISSSTPIACLGSSVTFTTAPSTGAVTPSYSWLINGNPISGATNSTYSTNSLTTGDSISVLINLNQGCFTTYSANSNQISTTISSGLNSLIGGSNNICFGESNGFIDATTSGGIAPYAYQWSNGVNTEDQTGLSAGTYSVTITDSAGCIFNSSFLIYQPPAPLSVSNVVTNATCFGSGNGSIDLTCTGGYGQYQFFWSNGSNTEDQNQLSPGNYWVNVVDNNSCVFSDTLNITEPTPINTTFSVPAVPCANDSTGSIDLTVTGGTGQYSFFWSNGFNGEDPSSLSSGSYQVTIIDANGCSDTTVTTLSSAASTSIVTQNTPPQMVCQGSTFSTIDVSATGGTISYQWYQNSIPSTFGGSPVSGANASNFTPSTAIAGTNYYYCIASGGCGSDTSFISGTQTVDSLLTPSVSITASSLTICNGLGIFFYANPTNAGSNPNYNWIINGLPIGINSDTIFNSSFTNGDVISLNITSNANCVSSTNATSNTLTVTVNSATNIISESLSTQTVCLNDTLQALSINASGANLTYQWFANSSPSYSGATSISGGTNASYQSASANPGTLYYYCVVNGACGTDTSSISGAQTVNNISQPTINIVASDTNICSGTIVSFTSNLNNGGSNPAYQWTLNGSAVTSANNPNFSSGSLTNGDVVNLILTPGTGACNNTTPVTSNGVNITVVATPTISVSNSGPYCEGSSIQLTANSNGNISWTGPNSYTSTQNNPIVGSASSNLAGTYIVTATTGTCSISDTTLVQVNNNPIAAAVTNQTITCINNTATISGSSNAPSSSFNWSGPGIVSGANTNSCQVNLGGVYILTVTQTATGCTGSDTIFVASNLTTPSVIADSIKFLACNQTSINIGSFSPDTGIVYQWNPPGNTPNSNNTTVSSIGNYTVTVTNTASGCSSSDVVIVASSGVLPDVNAGINQVLNCTTTVVTLNGSTTTPNTISIWSPAGTNPDSLNNEINAPGNYILTVTDTISGCSNSDTVMVTYDGSDCGDLDFYNGITPNGDGKNDVFYIKNISFHPNNLLIIFNRYGGKIWEGKDYDNNSVVFKGLDMNGIELPPGTYYYLLKYDGKIAKGWFELLK